MIHQLSHKLRAQITRFSGKLSEGLSKPSQRFVDEMIYGLTASQSVMLSEISRSLNESIPLIKTENRICRNLGKRDLCMHLQRSVASEQSKYIKNESLLILDLSDISKKYAEHMQYLGKVHDGSEGVIANGYWTVQVLGVEGDQLIPLYGHLYSASAPEFRSENLEIFRAIQLVSHFCNNQGTWVIDRDGDRMALFDYFLDNQQNFIVRLQQNRHLLKGPQSMIKQDVLTLAKTCPLLEERQIVKQKNGQDHTITLKYGKRCVRLPERPEQLLWLVVVHGFAEKPLMILTTKNHSAWKILEAYLTRWRIEETIRFAKQAFDMENIRLLTYRRLQNMYAFLMAALSFNMTFLTLRTKLQVMFTRALQATKTLFGAPDFHYYTLASGIALVFARAPKPKINPPNPPQYFQPRLL
jgi:hypothetical protein